MYLQMTTKCPYCGHEQTQRIDENGEARGQKITLCDAEDGGCDDYYAVFYKAIVSTTSFSVGKDTVPGIE